MGSKKKRRSCPILGEEITSAQCGNDRNSKHVCPRDCEYNPFAPDNYSDLLELEENLDGVCMQRLGAEDAHSDVAFWNQFRKGKLSDFQLHNGIVKKLFINRDSEELTFVDRWENAGITELRNDATILLHYKRRVGLGMLEVRSLPRPGHLKVVDLLRPDTASFEVIDQSLYSGAARFQLLLCWYYELPHYSRICGNATNVPSFGSFEPQELLNSIARHHGLPEDSDHIKSWLADQIDLVQDSLYAIGTARNRQMLQSIDAFTGKAIYDLTQPYSECRNLLDQNPQVDHDDLTNEEMDEGFNEARVWFEETDDESASSVAQSVYGRILLGQSSWRAEAMGKERFQQLRKKLESLLGDRLQFNCERLDNLGAKLAEEQDFDASLVPPDLLESPPQLSLQSTRTTTRIPEGGTAAMAAQINREHLASLLDTKIPALDDKSPRVAAKDPTLRARLIHWVKNLVRNHDTKNLEAGLTNDINWLIKELHLDEIDEPAPPPRAVPPQYKHSTAGDKNLDFEQPNNESPLPKLPKKPLSPEEAESRIDNFLSEFPTAHAAFTELERQGSTIIDDLFQASEGLIDDNDFDRAVTYFLQAWYSLVPRGYQAPDVDPFELTRIIDLKYDEILEALESETPDKFQAIFAKQRQPDLTLFLCQNLLIAQQDAPANIKISGQSMPGVLASLVAVIEILDDALRNPAA